MTIHIRAIIERTYAYANTIKYCLRIILFVYWVSTSILYYCILHSSSAIPTTLSGLCTSTGTIGKEANLSHISMWRIHKKMNPSLQKMTPSLQKMNPPPFYKRSVSDSFFVLISMWRSHIKKSNSALQKMNPPSFYKRSVAGSFIVLAGSFFVVAES